MYSLVISKRYRKSLKRLSRSSNIDFVVLNRVINMLLSGQPMPREFLDHQLSGNMKEFRECHVKNDLLLVYQIEKDVLILTLINIGTHASIFG